MHIAENHNSRNARGGYSHARGRGNNNKGRGRRKARKKSTFGNRPTCQLCLKYGHSVIDPSHRYDESFKPTQPKTQTNSHVAQSSEDKKNQASSSTQASSFLAHQDDSTFQQA